MKKLIVMLAIAASAIVASAASCNWSTEWAYDMEENDIAGKYWLVALTGSAYDGIAVSNTGDLIDAGKQIGKIYANGVALPEDLSAINGKITGLSEADNATKLALIVVDDAYAFYGIASGEITGIVDAGEGTQPKDASPVDFSNYYSSYEEYAMRADTATQAVPEPTSGLLMLLGMAGLALRRRRA